MDSLYYINDQFLVETAVVLNPLGLSALEQVFNSVSDLLSNFTSLTDYPQKLASVFGENFETLAAANTLSEAWKNSDFTIIPTIEIISDSDLNGANGAFSIQTNRIYLSESLINRANSSLIFNVILEEIGHKIDSVINDVDTAGDEGQLFSALVRGETLSTTELNAIKQENDHAIITIDGQAIAPDDYDNTPLTVTFADGEISKIVTIPVVDDPTLERSETLNLTLSNSTGGAILGTQQTATLTIIDRGITFQPGPEGKDTYVDSRPYTNAPATIPNPYNTVNWGSENRFLFGQNDGGQYNNTTGTLIEFDLSTLPSAGVSKVSLILTTLNPATSGVEPFSVTAHRITSAWDENTVTWNSSPNFDANPVSSTLVDDISGETFEWDITSLYLDWKNNGVNNYGLYLTSGPTSNGEGVGFVSSDNTDTPALRPKLQVALIDSYISFLSFSSATYSVNEDGTAITQVTINRTGGSDGVVNVTLTPSDGTAIAPDDYDNTPLTVIFADGETAKTVTIPIVNDSLIEGNETVNLTLSNPTGAAILDTQTTATFTIIDNDPTITINDLQVIEGQTSNAVLTVTLNSSSSQTVKVNYSTVSDTAIASSDYTSKTGTLTFNPGVTSQTITIPIVNNNISESNEQFFVNLSNPLNATMGDSQAVVTISDTLVASISTTLASGIENLTLTGTDNINGTGNSNGNLIIGNNGNNILNGSTGIDTLVGGLGNDTYTVDNLGDVVTETSSIATEIDTVNASVSYTLGANLENLTLTGSAAINGTGNAQNNILQGNSANNTLAGGNGNDTYRYLVSSNLGRDSITDSSGIDTLDFTGTTATVRVNLGITTTQTVVTGKLSLTLSANNAMENVIGGSGSDRLIGNSLNNSLAGGAGNDQLIGRGGNDSFVFSTGKAFATADVGIDTWTDFAGGDQIVLSKTTFTALTGDSLTQFAIVEDDSLVGDSAGVIVYSENSGSLYYNQNGAIAGLGTGAEFAFIANLASLTAADFTLIA
jgi:hypothetical protein